MPLRRYGRPVYYRPETGFVGAILPNVEFVLTNLDEIWQICCRAQNTIIGFNFTPIASWVAAGQTLRTSCL